VWMNEAGNMTCLTFTKYFFQSTLSSLVDANPLDKSIILYRFFLFCFIVRILPPILLNMRIFNMQSLSGLILAFFHGCNAASISYAIPATPPTGASSLDPAPVGVS
jgi:hypothetical protein